MRQLKIREKITNRSGESVNRYLSELGQKSELLTIEEEIELAKKIREDNDQIALNKLIVGNLRFVVSVANNYTNS